jgi:hypothetical protein
MMRPNARYIAGVAALYRNISTADARQMAASSRQSPVSEISAADARGCGKISENREASWQKPAGKSWVAARLVARRRW